MSNENFVQTKKKFQKNNNMVSHYSSSRRSFSTTSFMSPSTLVYGTPGPSQTTLKKKQYKTRKKDARTELQSLAVTTNELGDLFAFRQKKMERKKKKLTKQNIHSRDIIHPSALHKKSAYKVYIHELFFMSETISRRSAADLSLEIFAGDMYRKRV